MSDIDASGESKDARSRQGTVATRGKGPIVALNVAADVAGLAVVIVGLLNRDFLQVIIGCTLGLAVFGVWLVWRGSPAKPVILGTGILAAAMTVLAIVGTYRIVNTSNEAPRSLSTTATNAPPSGSNAATPPSVSANDAPKAAIKQPSDEKQVEGKEVHVEGTVQGLSSEGSLWCFVVNDGRRWFPFAAPVNRAGEWSVDVGIGPDRIRSTLSFEIHVVSATPEAADKLKMTVARGGEKNYDGLGELPKGAESLDMVRIHRTK